MNYKFRQGSAQLTALQPVHIFVTEDTRYTHLGGVNQELPERHRDGLTQIGVTALHNNYIVTALHNTS